MKKNLVTKKHLNKYYYEFLPKMEAILTLKKMHDEDLVVTKQSLAIWFEVPKAIIDGFFKQAEKDNLILLDKRTTKINDKKVAWGINRYILPASDSPFYYSKLQEYVNEYMYWCLDFGERIDFLHEYLAANEKEELKTKMLCKEVRSKMYLEQNPWTKDAVEKINSERPERLKSSYLAEGKLRENNFLCQTLNPEKEHQMRLLATDLNYRYNVLNDFFGTDKFIECDTNASIYRLSYNLNHSTLLSHDVDIYAEFWKLAKFNKDFTKEFREDLKVLCMPIFMSNGAKNGYNATLVYKDDMTLDRSEHNRKLILKKLSNVLNLTPREILDRLTEAMKQFIGTDRFLEAEIFIHESNLHLLILDYCMDHQIQTINVYDGFYFKESDMTQQKYCQIYDLATEKLKKMAV